MFFLLCYDEGTKQKKSLPLKCAHMRTCILTNIHKQKYTHAHIHTQSAQPYWDEFFVFEVRSPAFAVLRVKVMDHLHCWRPAVVGEVRSACSIDCVCVRVCVCAFECVCVFAACGSDHLLCWRPAVLSSALHINHTPIC